MSTVKVFMSERSMINPEESMVDQGEFPPDLTTNGIFPLIMETCSELVLVEKKGSGKGEREYN